ncbi:MAG: GldG family protein [Oscillospiraceae bacterium]|nr:GldG family protein [Oscillospiraceae bacterium]
MAEEKKNKQDKPADKAAPEKTEKAAPEKMDAAKPAENAEKPKKKRDPAMIKKLKYGGVATAITCVVVAVVILLNVLVSRLVERYPLKVDLTDNGMFEISEQTETYLKDLDKDVNFTVLMSENSFETNGITFKMISEMLNRYTQYSDKIHLTYADPTANPDVVSRYQKSYAGTLAESDIIVSDANDDTKMRVVKLSSLVSYDQQRNTYNFVGEQNLTAALLYVTDANPISVAVLATGNGSPIYNTSNNYSVGMFSSLLASNGYDVEVIDIYTDTLDPEKFDLAVLPAPVNDLTPSAIEMITTFLYNDGQYNKNMVYFADFTQGDTPNVDEMLSTWGIEVTKNMALEGNSSAAQQITLTVGTAAVPAVTIADETYSEGMINTTLPIVAPLCRPINLLWESTTSGITTSVLQTSDTVYLSEMGKSTEEADKTPAGKQTVMAVTSRKQMIDNVQHGSSIMVIGSMMVADYAVLQNASYNNATFLVNAVNVMTGKTNSVVISGKTIEEPTVAITTNQAIGLMVFVFMIPMVIIIVGIVVIARRKNR